MSNKLQTGDSLRVALEMERRGHQLYVRAQSLTQDMALRNLLAKLAEEEAGHFFHFQTLLQFVDPTAPRLEAMAMASAMAADFFYPGGLMQAAMEGALSSTVAMLDAAIQSEKDSIAFYEEMLLEADPQQEAVLQRIVREEQRHLEDLLLERENHQA